MSNTATNNLTYTGIVTISQYINDKKIQIAKVQNTGGIALFNFFANCLIWNTADAKNDLPARIKLINKSSSGEYSSASGFIFKRNVEKIVDNLGECRVRFTFMVPRDLLEDIPNISTLSLGLYSAYENDLSNYIAICELGDAGLDLTRAELTHASLLVDWELVIANKAKGTI